MPICAYSLCDETFILGSYRTKKFCSKRCYRRARGQRWQKKHKDVARKANTKWRRAHPEYKTDPVKGKNRELLKRYGITTEQKEARLLAQGGCCAVCGSASHNGRGWHTDHNHETGQLRDELCSNCNTALGMTRENPVVLQGLIDYLQKWSQQ